MLGASDALGVPVSQRNIAVLHVHAHTVCIAAAVTSNARTLLLIRRAAGRERVGDEDRRWRWCRIPPGRSRSRGSIHGTTQAAEACPPGEQRGRHEHQHSVPEMRDVDARRLRHWYRWRQLGCNARIDDGSARAGVGQRGRCRAGEAVRLRNTCAAKRAKGMAAAAGVVTAATSDTASLVLR